MSSKPKPLHSNLPRPSIACLIGAALYLLFSIADLVFSRVAFAYGIAEGNPVMASLVEVGLFVPGKIAISLLVTGLMIVVYTASRRWQWTTWAGVLLMGGVVGYHLWALPKVTGTDLVTLLF